MHFCLSNLTKTREKYIIFSEKQDKQATKIVRSEELGVRN